MKRTALLHVMIFAIAGSSAHARDYKVGSLDVIDPWSRATPKGANVAAGYMKITNNGTTPDQLLAGSTDAASTFEVHEMTVDGGVAKMRPVKGGLEIKPGETVELKPDSYHIMIMGLKNQFTAGDHVKATLTFEKAGKIDIDFDVLAMGAMPKMDMPGMSMPGMNMNGK